MIEFPKLRTFVLKARPRGRCARAVLFALTQPLSRAQNCIQAVQIDR